VSRPRTNAPAVMLSLSAGARYDGYTGAALAAMLQLPRVIVFDDVSSTLDVAHDLAARGALAGTLVLAEAQSAGRGRMGRSWRSDRNAGVWLTMIERPPTDDAVSVLSIRVALSLAQALDPFAGEQVAVKWPNDLCLGRPPRKLAGILLESRWRGARIDWLAAGVGINVRVPRGVNGAALRADADRIAVLRDVVPALRDALARHGPLSEAELAAYAARDQAVGRRCLEPADGVVAGIQATGALLVDTPRGREAFRGGSLVFMDATDRTSGEAP